MSDNVRVIKKQNKEMDVAYVTKLAEEFKKAKEATAVFEKRMTDLKKELTSVVEEFGVADDKGSLWVEVGDMKLKRERRVQTVFNNNEAVVWAQANGYWDDVKEVVEILSEDKLLGLAWNNKELEDTIQGFYVEKETWAFKA